MKKIYSLCIGVLLFQTANAQITLTATTHTPQLDDYIGANYEAITLEDDLFDFESISGPNQIWDFSEIEFYSSSATEFSYAAPDNDAFTGAEVVSVMPVYFSQFYDDYLMPEEQALRVVGHVVGWEEHFYSDGFDLLRFPMNYGDSYTDDVTGHIEFGTPGFPDWDKAGTVSVSIDAYGDLILPYGTFTNVVRVKTVMLLEKGVPGAMLPDNRTRYDWYHADFRSPVASCRRIDNMVAQNPWVFGVLDESEFQTLHIDENNNSLNNLYPNPASSYLMLPAGTEWSKFYDINGRLIKTTAAGEEQIDTSNFNAGMYFISFGIENQTYHRKITVQH